MYSYTKKLLPQLPKVNSKRILPVLLVFLQSLLFAQDELTQTKLVIDSIEAKKIQIIDTIPDGKIWEDGEEWWNQTQILQVGEVPNEEGQGIFQFHDMPASNIHDKSLVQFRIEDRNYMARYRFNAEADGNAYFTIFDDKQESAFSFGASAFGEAFLEMLKPGSHVVIGGRGTWPFDHKLIIKDGSGLFENSLYVGFEEKHELVADYELIVGGKGVMEELKIALQNTDAWPDYVFEDTYKLPSLKSVENYIKKKGHLKEMPSAKEIAKEEGFMLGALNAKLLKKIEELTLYTIAQEKQLEQQKSKNKELESRLEKLEKMILK